MSHVTRVGIIGTGGVGSSVAISTLQAGIAQELLLCDLRASIAEGEAMDLAHGAAFLSATLVLPAISPTVGIEYRDRPHMRQRSGRHRPLLSGNDPDHSLPVGHAFLLMQTGDRR